MLTGLSLIIASACVYNNYLDREIDKKMIRTQNRPLVKNLVSVKNAIIFSFFLGLLGTLILTLYTNYLTTALALSGFLAYVLLYGFFKYRSVHGTLIGSISGAIPPVVGYCAVTSHLDEKALLLFLAVALWQMPHFYAIAIYRLDDYIQAAMPVLPAKKGMYITKIHILFYLIVFTLTTLLFPLLGFVGKAFFIINGLLCFIWIGMGISGFKSTNDTKWARNLFLFSLIIINFFSLMMVIDVC